MDLQDARRPEERGSGMTFEEWREMHKDEPMPDYVARLCGIRPDPDRPIPDEDCTAVQ